MSKLILNGQKIFNALKSLRMGSNQSIRNNDQLIRLLPADMTEQGFSEYKSELESRINGFDLDVECETSLVSKEGTVIIAPLSTEFKQELTHRFFSAAHNVEDNHINARDQNNKVLAVRF